jgi:transposase
MQRGQSHGRGYVVRLRAGIPWMDLPELFGPWSSVGGARVCILPKSVSRIACRFDRSLYTHRHTIENFSAPIKRHVRIASRHDKTAGTFLGFVQFVTVLDWLTHEI